MNDTENRENPYVGLRPFFEADSFYFFGRNEQVTELLELLHDTHFVPVLGSSGSGKSSLVRAGLMPTLRAGFMVAQRDGWRMAKCLPGDTPIENFAEGLLKAIGDKPTQEQIAGLAEAIREDVGDAVVAALRPHVSEHETVLILVDQFEELFAFRNAAGAESDDDPSTKPDAARTAERLARRRDSSLMVSVLLALAERKDMPVYVVTTMRTDFLGDCDVFTGLPEAINRSGYLVPRLTRTQLRSAVENPAKLMGVRVAPRLVDRILNDVGDRMDRLPLMQHALHQTYEAWRTAGMMGPLDLRDLEKVGGLDGALNVQAEATIAGIDPLLAERVFKRLTAVDKNQRRIRRPTRLSDLRSVAGGATPAALQQLLDRCVMEGTNFLFVSPDGQPADPRYNITHESLIRQWNRLRGWVDEEQAERDWYLGVAARAALYASDKDSGLMPRRDLRVAAEVIKQRAPSAGWATRYPEAATSFADAMQFVHNSEQHLKAVRRSWIVGAAVLLIAASGAALSVLNNGRIATEALKRVDNVARLSVIERLLVEDPTYAASLAAELTDTTAWKPDRVGILQRALNADFATAEYRNVDAFDLDGTGTEIAIGYPGGRVEVGDIDGRGAQRQVFLTEPSDTVVQVEFMKNRGVLVGYRNGKVRLWRRSAEPSATPISTPERTWQLPVALNRLFRLADSISVLALDDSAHLFAWTTDQKSPHALMPDERIGDIYVHPTDAHRTVVTTEPKIATKNNNYDVRFVDVQSGAVGAALKGISRMVTFVSFADSSDGMLVGQARAPIVYFRGDRKVGTLGSGKDYVSAAINSNWNIAMTSSAFGVISQFSLDDVEKSNGKSIKPFSRFLAHEEWTQADYSRDAAWIVSWASDGAIRWTLANDSTVTTRLTGHRASVRLAVTSPTDSRIASWDADGTLRIWRKPSVTKAVAFSADPQGPWNADLSESGSKILLGYLGFNYRVRSLNDSATFEPLDQPVAPAAQVPSISPTGRRVFFQAGAAMIGHIWSHGNAVSATLAPRRDAVELAMFSDNDSLLVLTHAGGSVSFLNGTTGAPLRPDFVPAHKDRVSALQIAPSGRVVAIALPDAVWLIRGDSRIKIDHDTLGGSIVELKFSADGRKLLIVDEFGLAGVFDVGSDEKSQADTSVFHRASVGSYETAAAISATGELIALATEDRAIVIYNTADTVGSPPRALIKGLLGSTVHLAFGADNRTLVATGGDGDIRIWPLTATGALGKDAAPVVLQQTPKIPHQRGLPFARTVLSRDGKQLTSLFLVDSGTPRIGTWDLDFARIRQRLQQTTSACLDIAARKSLLPNETDEQRSERTDACERRAGRVR